MCPREAGGCLSASLRDAIPDPTLNRLDTNTDLPVQGAPSSRIHVGDRHPLLNLAYTHAPEDTDAVDDGLRDRPGAQSCPVDRVLRETWTLGFDRSYCSLLLQRLPSISSEAGSTNSGHELGSLFPRSLECGEWQQTDLQAEEC